jgi:thymidylate synthase (FAD)
MYRSYEKLLGSNIARELARINLPISLYTEWYWQIDLHNLFRFLKLRLDPHAQLEIREYAAVLRDIGARVCPVAFEAFDEHVLGSTTFSRWEMEALRDMLQGKEPGIEGKPLERLMKKLSPDRVGTV